MNDQLEDKKDLLGEGFLELILSLTDLSIHDKIGILERTADELFIQGDNLKMLEYKQAIKELKEQQLVQDIKDRQFTVKPSFWSSFYYVENSYIKRL